MCAEHGQHSEHGETIGQWEGGRIAGVWSEGNGRSGATLVHAKALQWLLLSRKRSGSEKTGIAKQQPGNKNSTASKRAAAASLNLPMKEVSLNKNERFAENLSDRNGHMFGEGGAAPPAESRVRCLPG